MNDQRKPSDDFKEGLGLLFRAVKTAAQQVDVGKVDKTLNQVITEAGRVVGTVGKVVADEVSRMSSSKGTTDVESEEPSPEANDVAESEEEASTSGEPPAHEPVVPDEQPAQPASHQAPENDEGPEVDKPADEQAD